MTYYNLVARLGPRALRAAPARVRRRRRDRPRPAARRARRLGRRGRRGRASRPCCSPRRPRPTTASPQICDRSHGFVYGVSLMGVTGERDELAAHAGEMGRRCKAATDKPVLLGVGISTPGAGRAGRGERRRRDRRQRPRPPPARRRRARRGRGLRPLTPRRARFLSRLAGARRPRRGAARCDKRPTAAPAGRRYHRC